MRVNLRPALSLKERLRRFPIIKIPAIAVNEILFRHRRRRRRRVRIGSIRRARQRLAGNTVAVAIQTMRVNARSARPFKESLRRRPIIKIPAIPVNKIDFRHRRSRRRRRRRSSIGAIARRAGQPLTSNAIAVMIQRMRINPGSARRLKKRLRRRPIPKIPAIPVNEIPFRHRRRGWGYRRRSRSRGRRSGIGSIIRRAGQRRASNAIAVPIQPIKIPIRPPGVKIKILRLPPSSKIRATPAQPPHAR